MCDKAKNNTIKKLKEQIKIIQKRRNSREVTKLNAMILGSHNYYKCATQVNLDFNKINFLVTRTLDIRLKNWTTSKPKFTGTYERLYGGYNGKIRTVDNITIFPIYGCKTKPPMNFSQDICNYTKQGREKIHKNIISCRKLIYYLLRVTNDNNSAEFNDNKISLIVGQHGKCYATARELEIGNMECHHRKAKCDGGSDEYKNLVWVCGEAHNLIHSTKQETVNKYLKLLSLDSQGLKCVNSLRKLVGNSVI